MLLERQFTEVPPVITDMQAWQEGTFTVGTAEESLPAESEEVQQTTELTTPLKTASVHVELAQKSMPSPQKNDPVIADLLQTWPEKSTGYTTDSW